MTKLELFLSYLDLTTNGVTLRYAGSQINLGGNGIEIISDQPILINGQYIGLNSSREEIEAELAENRKIENKYLEKIDGKSESRSQIRGTKTRQRQSASLCVASSACSAFGFRETQKNACGFDYSTAD